MRYLILVAILAIANTVLQADNYCPEGSDDVFTVTPEILATTPAWNPLSDEVPVSAANAIRVAATYHNKIIPTGRTEWYVFELAGATLVRSENDRWYWVVQYNAHFDPDVKPPKDGKLVGGWIGPAISHNRYPVLLNGKLAPSHRRRSSSNFAKNCVSDLNSRRRITMCWTEDRDVAVLTWKTQGAISVNTNVRRINMRPIARVFGHCAIAVVTLIAGCGPGNLTTNERMRQNITADLEQKGAYFVGFTEGTSIPDMACFLNVKSLDGIEKYPTLTHLDFTDSTVSDRHLREIVLLPNVFYLELDGTKVSDAGIEVLSAIPNLNMVDLTGTHVSDASVPALARIKGLQGVVAESANLSESGVRQLMKLRPDIWVKHESVTGPQDGEGEDQREDDLGDPRGGSDDEP
ncbi:hypothetical protein [Rhodopirellula halodulae]|uniref:hypothetical protein n=1 Tax=Rhodopirellula halodulae TaxID=2894198 RepID=UPI001E55DFCF|nr:hypothetical protein [Rhodopirellula sp. JC737]MCC9656749.1 hypothetical protein [Rhodopirellula sp. JC737]